MSFIVASLALIFTVTSFWWLNARRGRLTSFEPHSFAAFVNQDKTGIRLPLVVHNTGPAPIVVQDLRLVLVDEQAAKPLHWSITRSQLRPVVDDYVDMAAVFSVPGRSTKQIFIQFDGAFPGGPAPEPRSYRVAVEAKLGHRKKWRRLVTFDLQAGNMRHPGNYITYSNDPSFLSDELKAEARQALLSARGKAEAGIDAHSEASAEIEAPSSGTSAAAATVERGEADNA